MSKGEPKKLAILVKCIVLDKKFEKIDSCDKAILGMMAEEDVIEEN